MSMPLIRESACDCIHDIINKGMEPVAKTKLIESFTSILQNRGIFNPQEVRVHSLHVCVYSVKNRLTLCDRALIMECWCVFIIFRRRKEITWLNCPNLSMGLGSIWSINDQQIRESCEMSNLLINVHMIPSPITDIPLMQINTMPGRIKINRDRLRIS